MNKKIQLILLIVCSVFIAKAQNISNVSSYLSKDNKIKIVYELSGIKFYQTCDVELYVSSNNGETFTGPLKQVSGDIGKNISGGRKTILWDVLKEMPFTEESLTFEVRVLSNSQKVKKNVYLYYVGNPMTPIGARLAIGGKVGWFIEGRMSITQFPTDFKYSNSEPNFNTGTAYFRYTQEDNFNAISACTGAVFALGHNTQLYLSAGYGFQVYMKKTDNYDIDDNILSQSWVEFTDDRVEGLELGIGFTQSIGPVSVMAGAILLNFKDANAVIGIGFRI